MKPPTLAAALAAVVAVSPPEAQGQARMKGVFREGDTLTVSGTVIEATSTFVSVDAGPSRYKFPIQQRTRILDGRGRVISSDRFTKGQGVTVKVVSGDNVMEIRSGQLEMTLQPLKSIKDMPGLVTVGDGKDATTVWVANHTITLSDKVPGSGWEKLRVGAGESTVRNLLGEPGRKQAIDEWTIWWYRYADGATRLVAFREGKAREWKNVPSGY